MIPQGSPGFAPLETLGFQCGPPYRAFYVDSGDVNKGFMLI